MVNFLTCRYFVFNTRTGSFAAQLGTFLGSSAAFRVLEYLAYWFLLDVFGLWYFIAIWVVMPASFFAKYFFYKLVVFRS